MTDTHLRTLTKTVTWRIIATLTTIITIYYFTKSWALSFASGLSANFVKTFFYYAHERMWNSITWERIKQ
ncbi:DUF2061 domain-containing protein [Candidatus Woesearchaeota archaeon]|nr:DUF2061 domain-containing protein [Candidatus Woesearchaeota archaeon]